MRARDRSPGEPAGGRHRPAGRAEQTALPRLHAVRQAATADGSWAVPAAEIAAVLGVAGNSAAGQLFAPAAPTAPPAPPAPERSTVEDVVSRPGRPLDHDVRADLETRLGADLSAVRIHTGTAAHASAESVGAAAYTAGAHVVFRDGSYDPASAAGRHLLTHELVHVLQQRDGPVAGTDTGSGLSVSDPHDRFERAADATARAALQAPPAAAEPAPTAGTTPAGTIPTGTPGPAAPAAGISPASITATDTGVVQRSVGLELEHNVPIYRDLIGLNQEQSLRQGSFVYEDSPIYANGSIVVKVDNTEYSHELAKELRYNPNRYPTQIPPKGLGIVEYTTLAPGLDELQNGAAATFTQHVHDVQMELKANEAGQHQAGVYYTGLPAGFKPSRFFGGLGLQVTVGVFPSKLDALHRHAVANGFADRDLRYVQEDITTIMTDLDSVIGDITTALQGEAMDVYGDYWTDLRLQYVHNPGVLTLDGWIQNLRQDVIAPLLPVLAGTVRSLFRLGLSYYLGARREVGTGETDKNLVALLSRMELRDVFGKGGITRTLVRRKVTDTIVGLLEKNEDAISTAVTTRTGLYRKDPDPTVLPHRSPVDVLVDLIEGRLKSDLGPGVTLTTPDPLDITGKGYAEPSRPERGGPQFEYRSVAAGGWELKFPEIARQVFMMNIEHLPQNVQDQLWTNTGWPRP